MILEYLVEPLVALGLLVSALYYGATYLGARLFLGRRRACTRTADEDLPAVSVLKPLKGLEPELYENLATFFRQDYPKFEILFGVADPDDPAVSVVERLRAAHPEVRIELVVDGRTYGPNYKIGNLHNLYQAARCDVLLAADSDIRVAPDYLRRLVADLADPNVGLVTCLYRAAGEEDLVPLTESLFINTDFAPSVLVARLVEDTSYAFGATIALRRGVLDEIGGFLPISEYLADDFFIANRVFGRDYRVVISDVVVETVLPHNTWSGLFNHQLRWARTNRSLRPGGFLGLGLTQGTALGLIHLLLHSSEPLAWALTAGLWTLRVVSASVVASRYLGAPMRWRDALLILPKDLLGTVIWLSAFAGNTVRWGGHAFRVEPGGRMSRIG